jgi:hypothetical protein
MGERRYSDGIYDRFSLRSLRTSAYLCVKTIGNAEGRRDTQRTQRNSSAEIAIEILDDDAVVRLALFARG